MSLPVRRRSLFVFRIVKIVQCRQYWEDCYHQACLVTGSKIIKLEIVEDEVGHMRLSVLCTATHTRAKIHVQRACQAKFQGTRRVSIQALRRSETSDGGRSKGLSSIGPPV